MRDPEHGAACLSKAGDELVAQRRSGRGVQAGERFVDYHDGRGVREGSCDGHSLPHTARELRRVQLSSLQEPHRFKPVPRTVTTVGRADKLDVLERGAPWQEPGLLRPLWI